MDDLKDDCFYEIWSYPDGYSLDHTQMIQNTCSVCGGNIITQKWRYEPDLTTFEWKRSLIKFNFRYGYELRLFDGEEPGPYTYCYMMINSDGAHERI